MIKPCSIEISSNRDSSNKDKGDLLEKLAQIIFKKMQYSVVFELRKTGMEIDVEAKSIFGNKKVYIECKAWKENINAEVISKLLGNAFFLGHYDEAVLITTGLLGKEAKGIWNSRDTNEKLKNFTILQSEDIIKLLIDNNEIKSPLTLSIKEEEVFDYTLLITEISYFWAVKLVPSENVVDSLVLFDAKTGDEIANEEMLIKVKNTSNSLGSMNWIIRTQKNTEYEQNYNTSHNNFDNIIYVNSGEDWFDTRPSRPVDFIGRKSILNKVLKFYEDVLNKKTVTRIFSLMSPSGLGKSSLLLKIKEDVEKKYKSSAYVCNIDVRSANTENYINYVLMSLFKKLNDENFINLNIENIKFSNINNFFLNTEIQKALAQIKREKKLLVLNFDQFEEIISKIEFKKIFNDVKNLCFIVEELSANFVIGFSWKTDFSVSPEHPAYIIWNELRDHRIEFYLEKFTSKDCSECLSKYIEYSKFKKIGKLLSEYLITESNNLPWLLKKLCIHLEMNYDNIDNELDILIDGVKKEKIFEQDLEGLSSQDVACLRTIAGNSPADYFDMLTNYDKSVDTLIARRLIIKRGNKLVIYWDIFKDFLLNGSTPKFEVSFLPIMHYATIANALKILSKSQEIDLTEFAKSLNFKETTTTNIIIDLAKFDLINRTNGSISLKDSDLKNNIKKISKIMTQHSVVQSLYKIDEPNYDDFINIMYSIYDYNPKTFNMYCTKLYNWLKECNLISFEKPSQHNGELFYYIESTYKNVSKVLDSICVQKTQQTDFMQRPEKQVIQFLLKAHIITIKKELIVDKKSIDDVIEYIKELPPYHLTCEYMESTNSKNTSTAGLAAYLKKQFNPQWTETASRRYASWMHSWYNVINKTTKNQMNIWDLL